MGRISDGMQYQLLWPFFKKKKRSHLSCAELGGFGSGITHHPRAQPLASQSYRAYRDYFQGKKVNEKKVGSMEKGIGA